MGIAELVLSFEGLHPSYKVKCVGWMEAVCTDHHFTWPGKSFEA